MEARYAALVPTLDLAIATTPFDLDEFINYALGDLIHEIQTGFRRGEWSNEDELRNSQRVSWPRDTGFVELLGGSVGDGEFTCDLRLAEAIDASQRKVHVSRDTVAASYTLS